VSNQREVSSEILSRAFTEATVRGLVTGRILSYIATGFPPLLTNRKRLVKQREQVSFDRLLVRFFAEKNAPWLLKGGLRHGTALTDSAHDQGYRHPLPAEMVGAFDRDVVKRVQQSARIELADFFTFAFRLFRRRMILGLTGFCIWPYCQMCRKL